MLFRTAEIQKWLRRKKSVKMLNKKSQCKATLYPPASLLTTVYLMRSFQWGKVLHAIICWLSIFSCTLCCLNSEQSMSCSSLLMKTLRTISGSGPEQMRVIKSRLFGEGKPLHSGVLPHCISELQNQTLMGKLPVHWHNVRWIGCGYLRDELDRLGCRCGALSQVAG